MPLYSKPMQGRFFYEGKLLLVLGLLGLGGGLLGGSLLDRLLLCRDVGGRLLPRVSRVALGGSGILRLDLVRRGPFARDAVIRRLLRRGFGRRLRRRLLDRGGIIRRRSLLGGRGRLLGRGLLLALM